MIVGKWLTTSTKRLKQASAGTARLDALVLLEDATGKDRAWLLAHPETSLQGPTLQKLEEQLDMRTKHVPLAYIRGKTEFYGREFIINENVLEPRPESETMIDLLKMLHKDGPRANGIYKKHAIASNLYRIVDVGAGSGALGITAKLEIPNIEVMLTDIDPKCLSTARLNAKKHLADVKTVKGDLLIPILTLNPTPCTLLCNLPYVPDDYKINQAAMNEPRIAIFGGKDGLDLYRRLFEQITIAKIKPEYVLTESLPFQHKDLKQVAVKTGYKLLKEEDFIQVFIKL